MAYICISKFRKRLNEEVNLLRYSNLQASFFAYATVIVCLCVQLSFIGHAKKKLKFPFARACAITNIRIKRPSN